MEFKVTLSHPEDELSVDAVMDTIVWAIDEYILKNGHYSKYDSSTWTIQVEEIS